jgi:sodium-dependent dicarboxylate transporter 2/3/5
MLHLENIGPDAWLTLTVVAVTLVGLVREWLGPDVLLTGGVVLLTVAGVIDADQAFAGFANHGVLAVAGLFVVARAVENSGALDRLTRWVLESDRDGGKPPTEAGATLRVMLATASASSVLNNTPVIPVSYAAMLGGMCTIIGTSTNLVVAGMMENVGLESFGVFELAELGLPIAIVGIAFMAVFGARLLPGTLELASTRPQPEPEPVQQQPSFWRQPRTVLTVMAVMIAIPTLTSVPLVVAVFGAAIVLLLGKAISPREARASLELEVLVTIAMAFGLGTAMIESGLAEAVGQLLLAPAAAFGPLAVFAAVFIVTALFTELITNNAAAVLMFPIVTTVAGDLGMDARRMLIVMTVAASCSFATPIGYQTNMIVAKLGDYRFVDFLRAGVGMKLAAFLVTLLVAGLFW